jgi:hypothetical protein
MQQVVWREATLDDYPGIQECHHQLEIALGKDLDLPAFDAPSILTWMVAERDGRIVQFYCLEKLIEMRLGGMDSSALRQLIKDAPSIAQLTKDAGVRYLHVCVPPEVQQRIGRHLKRANVHKSDNILFAADLR